MSGTVPRRSTVDPNKALQDIREWAKATRIPGVTPGGRDNLCALVTSAVEALDAWLSEGGALPRAWARQRECVVLDGAELDSLRRSLAKADTLRVEPYPDGCKYKINGSAWSPIVGRTEILS